MSTFPIIDGHNDVLSRLSALEGKSAASFFAQSNQGHLDLPRARAGGLGGGFFSVFVSDPKDEADIASADVLPTRTGYEIPLPASLDADYSLRMSMAQVALLFRIERQAEGQAKVVRTVEQLTSCLHQGILAMILHFEGAEAIDPGLNTLEVFYEAGLRSLGLVWSRPNAFGYGVPFRFPHSPDTGPGLTDAGKALVRACNHLGILLDLAHLNERGFWDVARLAESPLVVTHTAAHALCPSTRNITDKQLDAIGASGGIVGVYFSVNQLHADGRRGDRTTPLSEIVRHLDYIAQRIGIDHVAFGSDFDGTMLPQALGDVTGLPKLIRLLRERGYDDTALRKITHENWIRVLSHTWKGDLISNPPCSQKG